MVQFESKFFSVAGQKERISNVGQTLKAAVLGRGVTADTGSTTANKVLSAAASKPFLTAGVAAAGATLLRNAPAIATAARSAVSRSSPAIATAAGATATRSSSNIAKNALLVGSGVVAGSLIGGGSDATAGEVEQTASQNNKPITSGTQEAESTSFQDNSQNYTTNTITENYGAGSIYSSSNQTPTFDTNANQSTSANPLFEQSSSFDPAQETSGSADAAATNKGLDLGTVIAVGAIAYLLSKN